MHEEKIALVRRQIEALAAAVASRNIRHVWVVALPQSCPRDWERIVWWFSTLKAAPRQRPSARRNWLRSAAL